MNGVGGAHLGRAPRPTDTQAEEEPRSQVPKQPRKPRGGRPPSAQFSSAPVADGDIFKTGNPILKALPPPTSAREIIDRAWLSAPWTPCQSSPAAEAAFDAWNGGSAGDDGATPAEEVRKTKRANGPNRDLARELLHHLLKDPEGPPVDSSALLRALGKGGQRNFLANHENAGKATSDDKLLIVDKHALHGGKRYWRPSVVRVLAAKWVDGVTEDTKRKIAALPTPAEYSISE